MTPRLTPRFSLQALESGDNPFVNSSKFFAADRDLIDMLLWLALTGHHHTGAAGSTEPPSVVLDATVEDAGGFIPASTRLWYTFTFVNDATGLETGLGPVVQVDTPEQVLAPERPTLAYGSASGTLLPGIYEYRMSAYTDVNTFESLASNVQGVSIPAGSSTNRVIIQLPDLPTGATGFNIYRRDPGSTAWYYLTSVDMDVATPPDEYVDDGTVELDCDRKHPTQNTTFGANQVVIEMQDTLPAGYHWRLYRTVNENDWSASLLSDVVEETFEGSGIYTTTYTDQGDATSTGEPPASTIDYGSPEQILLTDAAEVQGYLPMGRVSGFPHVVTLFFPGVQTVGPGEAEWPCPFPNARVIHACAALGRGMSPAADDLVIDVVIGRGTTPVFTTVYDLQADMPTIAVGENKTATGAAATATDPADHLLELGDVLSADIIQEGGSATPTDEDLTVTVLLYVEVGDPDVSETWA